MNPLFKLIRFASIVIAAGIVIAGCTNPMDDNNSPEIGDPTVQAQATEDIPVFQIVTPTAVDPASFQADATTTPTNLDVPATYVIQEGDSLYSVAVQFGVDIASLVAANNLTDPNDIEVGQELTIPNTAAPD